MTNPNDSAYPSDSEIDGIPEMRTWNKGLTNEFTTETPTKITVQSFGFSKHEEALLRFMCAIVSNKNMIDVINEGSIEWVKKSASGLTEAYFNELNREL